MFGMFEALKQTTLALAADASRKEKDAFIDRAESMDNITRVEFTLAVEDPDEEHKPAEELAKSSRNPFTAAGAQLYLESRSSNSTQTRISCRDCGSFGGGDMHFIFQAKDHRRPGLRGMLKDFLVRLKLIEEF